MVPLEIAIPVVTGLVAAIGALWYRDIKREAYIKELNALLLAEVGASRQVNSVLTTTVNQAMTEQIRTKTDQAATDNRIVVCITENSGKILEGVSQLRNQSTRSTWRW